MTIKRIFFFLMAIFFQAALFIPATGAMKGGPDAFGYRFFDSEEVDELEFSWIDIEADDIYTNLGNNEISAYLPIGFSFEFYGKSYDRVYISSNGFITFSNVFDSGFYGEPLPTLNGRRTNLIAGLWDALDIER